jgi:hypothetical protein
VGKDGARSASDVRAGAGAAGELKIKQAWILFLQTPRLGCNDNETVRDVNFVNVRRKARADIDSIFANVHARFGQAYQRDERDSLTPVLTLRYAHHPHGSYRSRSADSMFTAALSTPVPRSCQDHGCSHDLEIEFRLTHSRTRCTVRVRVKN